MAPEGDNNAHLPSPTPTPSPPMRKSTRITSKPVRFHEDTTLFPQSFLTVLEAIKDNMALLSFEFIEKPVLALYAYYSDFQQQYFDYDLQTIEEEHPLTLTICASRKDVLTYFEATKCQDFTKFKTAMLKEIRELEAKETWKMVPHSQVPADHKVLPSTWVLKRNRYPDARLRNYKAWFCADRSKQVRGRDCNNTYAPVVLWSTIRLMMTMYMVLDLKSGQVDYINAFVQAELDMEVHVELLRLFEAEQGGEPIVLKLQKSVYSLKQATLLWFEKLKQSLLICGFVQSKQDPCLFLRLDMSMVIYTHDVLIFAKTDNEILQVISSLKKDFDLKMEGTVSRFLGMKVKQIVEGYIISLPGHSNRILRSISLEDCNYTATLVLSIPLGSFPDSHPHDKETWNYASVIEMLL